MILRLAFLINFNEKLIKDGIQRILVARHFVLFVPFVVYLCQAMPRIRSFIAVEVGPSVISRAKDLMARLGAAGAEVGWVRPQQMHLTLKFLGDVPDTETPDICRVVEQAARQIEPFEIVFRCAGAFPRLDHPRTLWIGVQEGAEALKALHDAIDRDLHDQLGYARERRAFSPHLTIGRVKHEDPRQDGLLSQLLAEQADFDADLTVVDEVVTFASFLDRKGALHEALGRAELS